ncbi:hypothetical protein J4449_05045 [Candidatus Woesearchaeota archaeon]|nr:hypothetical protein [Candidatus Woesearchaeota archaeon]
MKKRAFFLLFLLILAYNVFSQEEIPLEGFIEDFGKNEEKILLVVESTSIRIGNPKSDSLEKHKFKVLEITQDSVNMSIDNKQNTILIPISQTRKGDVDKDGVFDVSFTVNAIRSRVASITIKSLGNKIEEFKSTTPSIPITETAQNSQEEIKENINQQIEIQEQTPEQQEISEKNPANYLLYLVVGIIAIILIIIALIIFIIKRKKEPEIKKLW